MASRSKVDLRRLEARRICLIKPSSLGDIVQTLPLLGALRRRFPEAEIAWLTNSLYAPLLEGHPHLAAVLRFERNADWRHPGAWVRSAGLMRQLRRSRFDLVLDLQGLFRTAVMTACTRALVRVGLESAREGANVACNVVVPGTAMALPAHRRYWRVAEALGAGDGPQETVVPVRDADRAWARERLAQLPRPIVAVHPGARWATKRWPVERFAEASAPVMARAGGSCVVVGGSAETPLAARFVELLAKQSESAAVLDLTGATTLTQLAAVLEACDALLTNDSGPMHLAAGLGTPVTAVFTCTSPERSGPPGDEHELIATRVPCAASYRKRCPYHGERRLACMRELDAERVSAGVARALARRGFAGAEASAIGAGATGSAQRLTISGF